MKTFRIIFPVLLITCFLASCSVEKRVYMRGYHVEWNKKGTEVVSQNEIISQPEIKNTVKKFPANIISINSKKENNPNTSSPSDTKTLIQKADRRDTTHFIVKKKQASPSTQNNSNQKNDDSRKTSRMASMSFTFAFVALIGLLVAFALGWGLFVFFLLFSIPALVFGIVALAQFKNNPGVYDNKWYAYLGTIVGAIETLALLLFAEVFVNNFL